MKHRGQDKTDSIRSFARLLGEALGNPDAVRLISRGFGGPSASQGRYIDVDCQFPQTKELIQTLLDQDKTGLDIKCLTISHAAYPHLENRMLRLSFSLEDGKFVKQLSALEDLLRALASSVTRLRKEQADASPKVRWHPSSKELTQAHRQVVELFEHALLDTTDKHKPVVFPWNRLGNLDPLPESHAPRVVLDVKSKEAASLVWDWFSNTQDMALPMAVVLPKGLALARFAHPVGLVFSEDTHIRAVQMDMVRALLPLMRQAMQPEKQTLAIRRLEKPRTFGTSVNESVLAPEDFAQAYHLAYNDHATDADAQARILKTVIPPQNPLRDMYMWDDRRLVMADVQTSEAIFDAYVAARDARAAKLPDPPRDRFFRPHDGVMVEADAGYVARQLQDQRYLGLGPATFYDPRFAGYRELSAQALGVLKNTSERLR